MHDSPTLWSFEPLLRGAARLGRALWRRRWVFTFAAALPIAATVIYVFEAPDRYAGTSRIIIGKNPADTTLPMSGGWTMPSNETQNQLEMIKSHEVVAAAAAAGRRRYPANPPGEAEITAALLVKQVKGTDIIEITAEAPTAERAAALANLVAAAYLDAHLRDRRKSAANAEGFIEGQVVIYEQRLRVSEAALEQFKSASGVISVSAQTDELVKTDAEYRKALEETRIDLAVAAEKRAFLEDELARAQSRLLATAGAVSSPVARQLQEKLVALEVRYAGLVLKGYSPTHPELAALAGEIASARGRLAEEAAVVAEEDAAENPFVRIENLAGEMDGVRAEHEALAARERELGGVLEGVNGRMAALPRAESAFAELAREKEANENIYMMLLEKREEARIAEASEVGSARIFSRAVPPARPFAPRRTQSFVLGLIAGLLFGGGAVGAVGYFDRTVKSPAVAREVTGVPVMGVIPAFGAVGVSDGRRRRRGGAAAGGAVPVTAPLMVRAPKSPPAEAFRALYAQIGHQLLRNGQRNVALGITSARTREGKSTVAINLALACAQFGVRTVLVDADLERSALSKNWGRERQPGVADFLRGEAAWEDVLTPSGIDNLSFVYAGKDTNKPLALLASPRFAVLCEHGAEASALTLIDTPPLFPVADTALVANVIKRFLLVARAGVVTPAELERTVHTLRQVGAEIVGLVLNAAEYGETYGYGYYRHYYYDRGEKEGKANAAKAPAGTAAAG
jgi:capsular exopolysaccharide synthesis family protein